MRGTHPVWGRARHQPLGPTLTEVRRNLLVAGTFLVLVACAQQSQRNPSEWAGHGRIQGQLWLGDQVLERGSLEMIQLSGPVEERCGPGACGIAVDSVLQGDLWPAGR